MHLRGNRVMPARAPGVAAQDATGTQRAALPSTVSLQRIQRVARTRGLKAARRPEPRAEQEPIATHACHQKSLHHEGAPTLANSCCNSCRTARRSASELALGNWRGSKPVFKRTTYWACGRLGCCAAKSRTWRRIRLRVTARLAQRLGIKIPRCHPANRAGVFSNPGPVAVPTGASHWCSTKCGVRIWRPWAMTAWKADQDFRLCTAPGL